MIYRSAALFRCTCLALVIANVYSESHSSKASDPSPTVNRLRSNTPDSTTEKDLGALLDAGDQAMVIVAAGDTRLVVHKAVLAARSPVMAAELEANSSHVTVAGVEGPVLRQLVALLYTPELPLQPIMTPQLQAAAARYGVPVVEAECWQQAAVPLSVETAAAAAVVAVRHSCTSLREAAIAFIKAHISQVMASEGWVAAVKNWKTEVLQVAQLLFDIPAVTSPATQPPGPTASAAAPPTPCRSCPANNVSVSPLTNLSDEEKGQRLIKAAKTGAVGELESLLAAGADVGARDTHGNTALYWASWRGHVETVRSLLAAGAEVDARDRLQVTPLHHAAGNGHVAVVRLLLGASADPNAVDGSGQTPLHVAALYDRAEVAAALISAGADKRARNKHGETPLDKAWSRKMRRVLGVI